MVLAPNAPIYGCLFTNGSRPSIAHMGDTEPPPIHDLAYIHRDSGCEAHMMMAVDETHNGLVR